MKDKAPEEIQQTGREAKQLDSLRKMLRVEDNNLFDIREKERRLSETKKLAEQRKKMLQGQIRTIKGDQIEISDHALLRYLERMKGLNTGEMRKEILTDKLKEIVKTLGNTGTFPTGNGFKVVMKEGVVVTIKT